ncbi:MAG: hypothetical protein AMXMBFR13_41220 [Phycisphaerae bacterium]
MFLCLVSLLAAEPATTRPPATSPADPQRVFREVQSELLARFEALLERRDKYQQRVLQECAFLPEGDLLPHAFLVYAYTNLALNAPDRRAMAQRRTGQLIDLLIPVVAGQVQPPGGKLENLTRFKEQAVYLGHLNMALGC